MSANYVNIAGGTTYTFTVDSSTLTLQNNQFRLVCKTAGGAITIILPKISDFGAGIDANIFIDDTDDMASVNNITVLVDESNTLENESSFVLSEDGQKVEIFIASKTEYGISGNSAGGAANATLLSLSDGTYPIESNSAQSLSAIGISKAYATFTYISPNNNLATILFPDLVTLIGGVDFEDDETGATTTVSFPKLEEATLSSLFVFVGMSSLISITAPKLKHVNGEESFFGFALLELITTLSFPELLTTTNFSVEENSLLTTLACDKLTDAESIDIGGNLVLPTVAFPVLTTVVLFINLSGNPLLESAGFPLLTSCDNFVISTNPSLTTILLNMAINSTAVDFSGNALTQASIDDILGKLDTAGQLNGTLNLTGGTNATPSAAGLVSKSSLVGKGWTVTNN